MNEQQGSKPDVRGKPTQKSLAKKISSEKTWQDTVDCNLCRENPSLPINHSSYLTVAISDAINV